MSQPRFKILALSHDPGGAEVLEPVVQEIRTQPDLDLEWIHTPQNRTLDGWMELARERLQQPRPDLLLTATSHGAALEKAFIRQANLLGIASLTLLDSWSNYRERFLEPGEELAPEFLPNRIGIMDKFSEIEMSELWFGVKRLRQVGQPGFDRFLQWAASTQAGAIKTQLRQNLTPKLGEKLLVFFSQPIEAMDGGPGNPTYRGYVESEVLELLLRALASCKGLAPFRLAIKLHPKEKSGKYDAMLKQNPVPAQVIDHARADELLLACDVALGMTTTMLVKGAFLKLPVISIQPNQLGQERLMLIRQGWIRPCGNEQEISRALAQAISADQDGNFHASLLKGTLGDGKSVRRIMSQIRILLKAQSVEVES